MPLSTLLVVDGTDWLHPIFYERFFGVKLRVIDLKEQRPPIELAIRGVGFVIIPGSMSYITDASPQTTYLLDLIRATFQAGIGMIGICHGHQAINLALGGRVERLPKPIRRICTATDGRISGLKSHSIKVVDSPLTAVLRQGDEIEVCHQESPFVFTTQYHFEVSPFLHPSLCCETIPLYVAWGHTREEIVHSMNQSDAAKLHRFQTSIAMRGWLAHIVRSSS